MARRSHRENKANSNNSIIHITTFGDLGRFYREIKNRIKPFSSPSSIGMDFELLSSGTSKFMLWLPHEKLLTYPAVSKQRTARSQIIILLPYNQKQLEELINKMDALEGSKEAVYLVFQTDENDLVLPKQSEDDKRTYELINAQEAFSDTETFKALLQTKVEVYRQRKRDAEEAYRNMAIEKMDCERCFSELEQAFQQERKVPELIEALGLRLIQLKASGDAKALEYYARAVTAGYCKIKTTRLSRFSRRIQREKFITACWEKAALSKEASLNAILTFASYLERYPNFSKKTDAGTQYLRAAASLLNANNSQPSDHDIQNMFIALMRASRMIKDSRVLDSLKNLHNPRIMRKFTLMVRLKLEIISRLLLATRFEQEQEQQLSTILDLLRNQDKPILWKVFAQHFLNEFPLVKNNALCL